MLSLPEALGIALGDRVALVGGGGKTSLLWRLAAAFGQHSVLVTTTTKIMMPAAGLYSRFLPGEALAAAPAQPGVTLAGCACGGGKLQGPPPNALAQAAARYSLVLAEADGAKCRPLKGWAGYEPVVPAFTTVMVGVLALWPLGRPADEACIHRLPLFCAMAGCAPGEALTPAHVARVIAHPSGMFAKARGRRVLFINQVENEEQMHMARQLAALLSPAFTATLGRAVAGSVQNNQGRVLLS